MPARMFDPELKHPLRMHNPASKRVLRRILATKVDVDYRTIRSSDFLKLTFDAPEFKGSAITLLHKVFGIKHRPGSKIRTACDVQNLLWHAFEDKFSRDTFSCTEEIQGMGTIGEWHYDVKPNKLEASTTAEVAILAFRALDKRRQDIVMRKEQGETFEEIAEDYDCGRTRIQQLNADSLEKIRSALNAHNQQTVEETSTLPDNKVPSNPTFSLAKSLNTCLYKGKQHSSKWNLLVAIINNPDEHAVVREEAKKMLIKMMKATNKYYLEQDERWAKSREEGLAIYKQEPPLFVSYTHPRTVLSHTMRLVVHERTEELRQHLARGGAVTTDDEWGSPLHIACGNAYLDGIKLLLEHSADLSAKDDRGRTPFEKLVDVGNVVPPRDKVIIFLIKYIEEHGSEKDRAIAMKWKTDYASKKLLTVARHPSEDYVINSGRLEAALEAGADVEVRDHNGKTPLMIAAQKGHSEIVYHLLIHGADPFAFDSKHKKTAIDLASDFRWYGPKRARLILLLHQKMQQELPGRKPELNNQLLDAADQGDTETMSALLKLGADVDARFMCGETPLMLAAVGDHVDAVKLLISHGADVKVTDNTGWNAKKHAEMQKNEEISQILANLMQ